MNTKSKECEWLIITDDYYYDTNCGQAFYFLDGETLSENKEFKYCPYCGRVIKETVLALDEEE